jgi:hypothetical protein
MKLFYEPGGNMPDGQSPIFSKTYDLILWLLNHTEHFPKSERFRLGKRIEDTAFAFYDLLIDAARSQHRRDALQDADLELTRLRLYLRLAHARKLSTPDQYEYTSAVLTELGRLLGGWLRSVAETQGVP